MHESQLVAERLPASARKVIAETIPLYGWPHDTLAPIITNACDLHLSIDVAFSPDGAPIVLVCHTNPTNC